MKPDLLNRARKIYEDEGIRGLYTSTLSFVRRGFQRYEYQSSRVDNNNRWELINHQINQENGTALDIGCAEGYMTNRLAKEGYFSIGIDIQADRVSDAQKKYGIEEGLGFMKYKLTPDNIEIIPDTNIILLLTVYHHWINQFGKGKSENMLEHLVDHSDKLFIELPRKNLSFLPIKNSEDFIQAYEIYFNQAVNYDIDVVFLGKTQYKGNSRGDLLFMIS
jgi:SAM-dependent methyltransferase